MSYIFYHEYKIYPQSSEGYLKNFDYENNTDPTKTTASKY